MLLGSDDAGFNNHLRIYHCATLILSKELTELEGKCQCMMVLLLCDLGNGNPGNISALYTGTFRDINRDDPLVHRKVLRKNNIKYSDLLRTARSGWLEGEALTTACWVLCAYWAYSIMAARRRIWVVRTLLRTPRVGTTTTSAVCKMIRLQCPHLLAGGIRSSDINMCDGTCSEITPCKATLFFY